jgi:hypothetical protein
MAENNGSSKLAFFLIGFPARGSNPGYGRLGLVAEHKG